MATLIRLASFDGASQGATPALGPLHLDAAGDLFGAAIVGGSSGYGTAFELARSGAGYSTSIAPLVSFPIGNALPYGGLVADAAGNLFGTSFAQGINNLGTVFKIAKTTGGYASAATTLASFSGTGSESSLILDAAGDLFGTTISGGASGNGTVFELVKSAAGYSGTPITLATFTGANGSDPQSALYADAAGNLYGTTAGGGANGCGSVFEIPFSNGGYGALQTLASFDSTDKGSFSTLVADPAGDLFGTTDDAAAATGSVFEIAKTAAGYDAAPVTLARFTGATAAQPHAGLVIDRRGNLFGTTASGFASAQGTVYEVAKTATGYNPTPITLATFSGANGSQPEAALVADAAGNLFGTTVFGGTSGNGTIFEITGAGYQTGVACYLRGTGIATPVGRIPIEQLRLGDFVLRHAGGPAPIRWIGRRSYPAQGGPHPASVLPVRIRAGALGDGLPLRDLFLSPEHGVFLDGVLIPARLLLDGVGITQGPIGTSIAYFHLELDRHAILLAEGVGAESWLDTGNRTLFANGRNATSAQATSGACPPGAGCARLVTRGPVLDRVRRRIEAACRGTVRDRDEAADRTRPTALDGLAFAVAARGGTRHGAYAAEA